MREGGFSKKTITILYKRAGEHCSLCKRITTKPHSDPEKFHNLGEAAHIYGLKNVPNLRFNAKININQLKNVKNGIWLCQSCHHIIDNDESTYTAEKLLEIKQSHELLVSKVHESGDTLMPRLAVKDNEIRRYQKMISNMELEIDGRDVLYNEELNKIKFDLFTVKKERDFLYLQLLKIKEQIIDLDDKALQIILLDESDIPKALKVLDEEELSHSEMTLAKNRILRARLLISNGDFVNAEQNFERAFQIWPRFLVAFEYIQFLYCKKLHYSKVIDICKIALNNDPTSLERINMLENIAQAYLKLGMPTLAKENLICAKKTLEEINQVNKGLENDASEICHLASIEKYIGDCFKLTGHLNIAIKIYESALMIYFKAFIIDKNAGSEKELAGLATAIGLVYEENNNELEALVHHLRAFEILKNITDCEKVKAIILINLASCYLKRKNFNPFTAKNYIIKSINILTELSKNDPNEFLEYLVGAKCIFADINFILKLDETQNMYQETLELAQILYKQNSVFLHVISHVQYNYSIYLILAEKNYIKGLEILDDSISKIKESQLAKIEYVSYLSQALFFKVEISSDVDIKKELLKEILILTQDLDPSDKSNIWRIKAEGFINNLEQESN